MSRSGVRGAIGVWLGLIVLQTVATTGSGRVASLMGDVNRLVQHALSPTVPAIPDRRAPKKTDLGTAPPPSPSTRVPMPGHAVPS